MIIEAAILATGAVIVQAIRSAERIHKRVLDTEAIEDIDVPEVRRVLERDRAEWLGTCHANERLGKDDAMRACTRKVAEIDQKLLALAGYRGDQ